MKFIALTRHDGVRFLCNPFKIKEIYNYNNEAYPNGKAVLYYADGSEIVVKEELNQILFVINQ